MPAGELLFVDTNVVLYTVDPEEAWKRQAASHWMDALWFHGAGRLSWQVLNEFYSNLVGKFKASKKEARACVEALAQWQPIGFGLGLVQRAWYWNDKAGVPYWDGLILASAESAGCSYLLTEDFQAGRRFGDVTVVNPFTRRPEEFRL
ncbi:MAG TPA: PIN domain-containing protein [Bryobacteraceae bacterium]|nr:PIN domain-containing protein [Bryobacteraceae bacterium]